VVKPGHTVIDNAPREDMLIVEAQLSTQDIGYVRVSQEAILKLNSTFWSCYLQGDLDHLADKLLRQEDGYPY
jgi:hypothetical protein